MQAVPPAAGEDPELQRAAGEGMPEVRRRTGAGNLRPGHPVQRRGLVRERLCEIGREKGARKWFRRESKKQARKFFGEQIGK